MDIHPSLRPPLASPQELRDLMQHAIHVTRKILPTEGLAPALLVLARQGPGAPALTLVFVLEAPFTEPEEKYPLLEAVGAQLCRQQLVPIAAVLVSEAWMAPDDPGRPRDHPERQEVIVVSGLTLGRGCQLVTAAQVRRDDKDRMHLAEDFPEPSALDNPTLLDHFYIGYGRALEARLATE